MSHKLHTRVSINPECVQQIKKEIGSIKIIRSVELVTVAFELGLLDRYLIQKGIPNLRKTLLESVLWGVKTDGCAVSEKEIKQIVKMEMV